ncbi:iron complex outermembrane recepter protein [Parasphingorhabdus marina DSM 22363]|uniref:Iron complex outermembrane recepter protein n=1 Tax=Parasphingorhabdus marina DSM 22363 TaxID=1123272 RepID=A0A1N6GVA2_9SPHN|nr:TonB-dependent receptor [Parasphingorhabdus marina]SIO11473.1 iron complex outermembrane recepter protein [Parasphingorhabdus marina DSM 22363]
MRVSRLLTSTALVLTPLSPALAQSAQEEAGGDDFHNREAIVVTAPYLDQLDILAGTSALSGEDLAEDLRGQIGDSLTKLPGVSSTSFAPGSSRPVLRGFQGPRVRVLTDGIGTLDASNTSVDHAVTIDPLTAQRVEVLRGPAVLLFGGDAIGGAVNVIDKRIPRDVPEEPVHIDALGGFGSAADDWSIAGSVDVPLTSKLVLHVDGSFRDTDDVRIPGFAVAPELRAELLEEAAEEEAEGELEEAEEFREAANQRGRVENTATRTWTAGAGLAFIDEGGNLGFSVSYYDSDYGVPGRPGAGHHHGEEDGDDDGGEEEEEEGPVTIGMEQFRADLRGGVNFDGFFESLNLRAGYSNYEHTEFEGDEIGTLFMVEGIEARAELVQRERNGWRGVIGTQFLTRDFNAIGAEAFVPQNDIESWALFTVQEIDLGDYEVEGALRFETTDITANSVNFDRSFDAFSAALGFAYSPGDEALRIGANLSRSERAPAAEELLSNGPHIATQAFEIGNPNFTTEKSWGGELYARWDSDNVNLGVTLYANLFDDFIFETETGAEEDDLPVFQFFQQDATYYGIEASASAVVARSGGFDFVVDGVADYVRAKIDNGGGPVPRIPPLRLLGGLEAQSGNVDIRAEVEWVDDQDRVTTFETATDGFTMVNASAAWRPFGREGGVTLLASANNIFDVNARRHASFTKDFVPLAGRDIRVSAKFSF